MRFLLALLLAATASAQSPDPTATRGRKILDDAITALGGTAYLNLRDFHTEGRAFSFDRFEDINGLSPIVSYERQPDKYRQVIGKKQDYIVVMNGDHGWDSNFRGVAELPAPEVERIRLSRQLSVDVILRFRRNEPGMDVNFMKTDFVDGRPTDFVEINDKDNKRVTIGFDQQTHLPVRREWERKLPNAKEREQWVEELGKYHPAKNSSVLFPFYVRRERNGIKVFEGFITEADASSRLSDALFERPAGKERIDVPSRKK